MPVKFYNGTAHAVNILRFNEDVFEFKQDIRKWVVRKGAAIEIIRSFPQQTMLSLDFDIQDSAIDNIPIRDRVLTHRDSLPEGYDFYIVSAQFAAAYPNDDRLLTISDPVYSDPDNPRPVGCLGLGRVRIPNRTSSAYNVISRAVSEQAADVIKKLQDDIKSGTGSDKRLQIAQAFETYVKTILLVGK